MDMHGEVTDGHLFDSIEHNQIFKVKKYFESVHHGRAVYDEGVGFGLDGAEPVEMHHVLAEFF